MIRKMTKQEKKTEMINHLRKAQELCKEGKIGEAIYEALTLSNIWGTDLITEEEKSSFYFEIARTSADELTGYKNHNTFNYTIECLINEKLLA